MNKRFIGKKIDTTRLTVVQIAAKITKVILIFILASLTFLLFK